jgi:hypothetical protein
MGPAGRIGGALLGAIKQRHSRPMKRAHVGTMPHLLVRSSLFLLPFLFFLGCTAGSDSPLQPPGGAADTKTQDLTGRYGPSKDPGKSTVTDGGETECKRITDCPDERPLCDKERGVCVECMIEADCGGERRCVGGKCVSEEACTPGERVCNGNELWTCRDTGAGFDREVCEGLCFGVGAPRCVICEPGTRRCNGKAVEMCTLGGEGPEYSEIETCENTCREGGCLVCSPGAKRCSDDVIEECSAVGTGWMRGDDCSEAVGGKICYRGSCVDPCSDAYKFSTNVGCEYWAADLDQAVSQGFNADDGPFAIVVANVGTKHAASVTLFKDGTEMKTVQVEPLDLHVFDALPPHNITGTMQAPRSYQIKSTRPIIAYQFNPLDNVNVFSNDASMLLPQNSLGRRYMVLGWPQRGSFATYVTVVATRPDTEVTVQVSAPTIAGAPVPAIAAGEAYTTTLQPFEVLNLETGEQGADLSGTIVESSKHVAVFFGTEASNVPWKQPCLGGQCLYTPPISCNTDLECPISCCADHLEQQLVPQSALGKKYVAARSRARGGEGDFWRVLAILDNTNVTMTPALATVPVLNAGQIYEFETLGSFVLEASGPVLLGQFLVSEKGPRPDFGGNCVSPAQRRVCSISGRTCSLDADCAHGGVCEQGYSGICATNNLQACGQAQHCVDTYNPSDPNVGDPAYIIGVPVEQLRDDYIFLVPDKYAENYVTIYAEEETEVRVDGHPLAAEAWLQVAQGWRILHLAMEEGVHRATGTAPFGVMVHGYDRFVSYGYPAGMNVTDLNAGAGN